MLVGTGGLTLFPGTPLLEEAQRGEFDPLSEKEMLEELRLFVEHLEIDCTFVTHHTVAANLTGPGFLARKDSILTALGCSHNHCLFCTYFKDQKFSNSPMMKTAELLHKYFPSVKSIGGCARVDNFYDKTVEPFRKYREQIIRAFL